MGKDEEIPPKEERPQLDEETFKRLFEEGQEFRKAVEKAGRPSRIITPEDWLRRSR